MNTSIQTISMMQQRGGGEGKRTEQNRTEEKRGEEKRITRTRLKWLTYFGQNETYCI
jgi:hypothetical protein